uniref:RNase H type-1 domain-containing protein n=1 Tax=Lactuca sativa TaxID=4236 RepID=A0A9R1XS35_LACSA|nr:hypothetical protein LSAT_V11C100041220 [Lactuca sativa]
MKFNLGKCIFGVEEGQFLGYYVTRQGTQPRPVEVDELMETPPLNTLRDVQGLNGKLTALSRFVSKSDDKAMPLFHTLKGCIEKRKFQWTAAEEAALQKIKEAMDKLSSLASTILDEMLQPYHHVICREVRGTKANILCQLGVARYRAPLSRSRNSMLAIIYAARRLRPRNVELGEHDIDYHPQTSINGQALVDFLLEIPGEGDIAQEGILTTLYTNETSGREGSAVGLILNNPEGEAVTYALIFEFHTSNNEAKYKALLARLRLTKQIGVEVVTRLTDSRLATNQVNGSFETTDRRMERYVKIVWQLTKSFKEFAIKQISRSENRRADTLSKLASTCLDHLPKKVLLEVLKERSVDERQLNTLTAS